MRRKLPIACIASATLGMGLMGLVRGPEATAQRPREEPAAEWEYKVGVLSFNPGEAQADERRAALFARSLNEQARQGWEFAGTILSRDSVQTVGGAVTTRDTTSFLAYRRRK